MIAIRHNAKSVRVRNSVAQYLLMDAMQVAGI